MPRWTIWLIRRETRPKYLISPCQHRQILQRGFTVIELIVALVLLSILAAVIIPNYLAMQERGREAMVLENMRMVQLAAEAYAVDFSEYPRDLLTPGQAFGFYFPGGDQDGQTRLGQFPVNPYTGTCLVPTDFYYIQYMYRFDNCNNQISGSNHWSVGRAGVIRYGFFRDGWITKHYGIIGTRRDGLSLRTSRIWVLYD